MYTFHLAAGIAGTFLNSNQNTMHVDSLAFTHDCYSIENEGCIFFRATASYLICGFLT